MFTGIYLPAVCERARRSGNAADKAEAGRLAQGLLLLAASVSDVPGFIARGIGTEGRCHYPLGSEDQTLPWFYGLHAYVLSGLPDEEERLQVVSKMREVAEALEKTNYNQTELAQSLGTSQFTVLAWALGERDVTVRLLLALEDLTGMTFRELFGECEGRDGRV